MRAQVLHSLKWIAAGKAVSQTLRWLLTFWVIRILTPEDYGYVAMAEVAFSFLTMVLSAIFSPYLIQSKHLSDSAIGQALGMTFLIHLALALLQYTAAPLVGAYFQSDTVTAILRTNALCFILTGFAAVPTALLNRQMKFKALSIISAICNAIAALSTLALAYLDFGFWALVYGEIIFIACRCLLVVLAAPVRVAPRLRGGDARNMFSFGGLLLIQSFLAYIYINMDIAIGGRLLTAEEIGLYAIALQVALMPHKKIMPMLRSVAFPAFSRIQENASEITRYMLKAQRLCFLVTVPIFWGGAAVAEAAIPLALGQRWADAVWPTVFILSVMPLRFSQELYSPALKSQRRVPELIRNTLTNVSVMFVAIVVGCQYGVAGLALAWTFGFPLSFTMILRRNARIFGITGRDLLSIMAPPAIAGALMLAAVFVIGSAPLESPILLLGAQILSGIIVYIGVLLCISRSSLRELVDLAR